MQDVNCGICHMPLYSPCHCEAEWKYMVDEEVIPHSNYKKTLVWGPDWNDSVCGLNV
jgi:hypothetical protein